MSESASALARGIEDARPLMDRFTDILDQAHALADFNTSLGVTFPGGHLGPIHPTESAELRRAALGILHVRLLGVVKALRALGMEVEVPQDAQEFCAWVAPGECKAVIEDEDEDEDATCDPCGGEGYCPDCVGEGDDECPQCGGSGACGDCGGTGVLE